MLAWLLTAGCVSGSSRSYQGSSRLVPGDSCCIIECATFADLSVTTYGAHGVIAGGAVEYVKAGGSLTVNNSRFVSCYAAEGEGGAVYSNTGDVKVGRCCGAECSSLRGFLFWLSCGSASRLSQVLAFS